MKSHFSEADIAVLESFRDGSGINPVALDALSMIGHLDSGLSFGPDPSIWEPSDFTAAICPALSILTQEKVNDHILWSLVFQGIQDGLSSFRDRTRQFNIANGVHAVLKCYVEDARGMI